LGLLPGQKEGRAAWPALCNGRRSARQARRCNGTTFAGAVGGARSRPPRSPHSSVSCAAPSASGA